MFFYLTLELISVLIGLTALLFFLRAVYKQLPIDKVSIKSFVKNPRFALPLLVVAVALCVGFFAHTTYPPHFAMPPFLNSHAPGGMPPSLPFIKAIEFLAKSGNFEDVDWIGADPNTVPATAVAAEVDDIVRIKLEVQEVLAEVAPGIYYNYWTFNKQVPGPFLRVREGDTIEVTLTNHQSSLHEHNIDLHAVTGPGGGASITTVKPGETKIFRWKALNPGLFVYHCAMPNVSTHNSHGQYGLIFVEPKNGLPQVDKEFYIMQGELYTQGGLGKKGLTVFDAHGLLDGKPTYVTFNGRVEVLPRMKAKVGETVRMYVGNGGVNLISSFHVIGEIFDAVYPNASIGGALEKNTQTALVLPGGASIIEMKLDVPGKYVLVDHALARMNKGAWAVLEVEGPENPQVFSAE